MKFRERLAAGERLLLDGAMGSLLFQRGLERGLAPEAWNLDRRQDVEDVADAYATAGADIVLTNTFGGSPLRLAEFDLADRCAEINAAAVEAARAGAKDRALVAGSMGPSGKLLVPYGDTDADTMRESFAGQADALVAAGVDLICVETMTDLAEAKIALEAVRAAAGADLVVTAAMSFEITARGPFTIMGNDVATVAAELAAAGADIVGSNCGQGSEGMLAVAREFAVRSTRPVLIQANAGLPMIRGGEVVYPETPEEMATAVKEMLDFGVRLVGGCCGTTPEHIAAMRKVLDESPA